MELQDMQEKVTSLVPHYLSLLLSEYKVLTETGWQDLQLTHGQEAGQPQKFMKML